MPPADLELIKRCLEGELSSFDELMHRYEKKVYSLCFRMTGNTEDAADLAQEAFLKAYRALPAFRGQASFSTWLYRIVTNTCLDGHRRAALRPAFLSLDNTLDTEDGELLPELPGNSPDPQSSFLQAELQQEIGSLLGNLPAGQRLVLVMRDLEGYSYEEIAAALNVSLGTVKSRLNRARLRLRALYLRQEELSSLSVHLKVKGGVSHDL